MAGNGNGNPAMHFGRQMRKERMARGWSIHELARQAEIDAGHLSRVENGKRPPTERIAEACDRVFPDRKGWFTEYYSELQGWSEVPAAFRNWTEREDKATTLHVWCPSIVEGLLQTANYATALMNAVPGATPEIVSQRLTARLDRQRRILDRDDPPKLLFLVDEMALYRRVGSPAIMAGQLRHLLEVAAMPNVTMQVMPAVEHGANASVLIVADGQTAYAEHVAGGYVYTDDNTVSALATRFDRLRAECYRMSETAAILRKVEAIWATGANPLTVTATADLA